MYFTFKAIYESEDTGVIDTPEQRTFLALDQQSSVHWVGSERLWAIGFYTVNVYINDEKVASDSFEIYSDR